MGNPGFGSDAILQPSGIDMPFQVVDTDERQVVRHGQTFGGVDSDKE